jgi:hypothetical protein
VTPRELGRSHIGELQQLLLKGGCYLVDLPNRDPRDLALAATASASSEASGAGGAKMKASDAIDGFARVTAEHGPSAWLADKSRPGPHWIELSWPEPKRFNVVHVTYFTRDLAPSRFQIEAFVNDAWVRVAAPQQKLRRHVLAIDRTTAAKLRLVLPEPAGVCEIRVYDEPARVADIAKRAALNQARPDGPDARFPWERPGVTDLGPADAGLPAAELAKKYSGLLLDASGADLAGDWVPSTHTPPYVGENYLHDGNADKGSRSIVFRPDVPRAGTYEILLAYAALDNRSSRTPVTISTPKGGDRTLRVDQRRKPAVDGLFHSLGRFELEAGDKTRIVISNEGTDGYVVVDAILLIPKSDGMR